MPDGLTRAVAWLRTRWFLISLVAIVAAALLAAVPTLLHLPEYPAHTAASLRNSELVSRANLSSQARLALEKDLLLYETDNRIKIWTAIVQAIGGAALFVGLLFTWRNLRATQLKLDIDREAQLTNRFTAATSQLGAQLSDGKPNVEARLGGIYALSSIARDSPRDYWPVMEILTAYVRHNAVWRNIEQEDSLPSSVRSPESKPRTDIQAILTVLGRSTPPEPKARPDQKFDLRYTNLRGAEFWDARLERTDFWDAHLEGAKLWGARLEDAKLVKAHLRGANLKGVKFEGADLSEADLTGADLTGADLTSADLTSADLTGADLTGADLRNATGLTREQVVSAQDKGDGALLPQDFTGASTKAKSRPTPH
jgi:pentapeptide repeat protein